MLSSIKLGIADKLKDRGYRHRFFRGHAQDEVASRIKELREFRKLRQTDLAERCDMKQSAVSRIEQASYSRWNIDTLWRIAEALDVRMRITFEPMENVIQKYEEWEKDVEVPPVFTETVERVPHLVAISGLGLHEPITGAAAEAYVASRHRGPSLPITQELAREGVSGAMAQAGPL